MCWFNFLIYLFSSNSTILSLDLTQCRKKRGSKMNVEFGREQTNIEITREGQDDKNDINFLPYLWPEEQKMMYDNYIIVTSCCLFRWSYSENMNGRRQITFWPDLRACEGNFRKQGKGARDQRPDPFLSQTRHRQQSRQRGLEKQDVADQRAVRPYLRQHQSFSCLL